jgi:hypothetical protein
MKKNIFIILTVSILSLFLFGCNNELENELGLLDRRITALEEKCSQMNTNITALQTILNALEEYDFITSVTTVYENGVAVGYTISFTHSASITIYNGKNQETPIVGAKMDTDGIYYWTIKYNSEEETWILNNYGQKVPAAATKPTLKIENGYWKITYDNGDIWITLGKATGDPGLSFISEVIDSTEYIVFKFLDNTTVSIPTWSTYEALRTRISRTNTNLSSFQTAVNAVDKNLFITNIIPIIEGSDTIGHRFILSDTTDFVIYNGSAGNAPVIGAKKDFTGSHYYWTIKYDGEEETWLLSDGEKVRVDATDGVAPTLSIKKYTDNLYYWAIAYGSLPESWLKSMTGEMVLASAITKQVFSNITINSDNIILTLAEDNETTITIPLYKSIQVNVATSINMGSSNYMEVNYSITGTTPENEVLAIAKDGFIVKVLKNSYSSGRICISSPPTFIAGHTSSILFLVSDGKGNTTTITINISFQ